MANTFSTSGTLVGAPISIDIQVGAGFVAGYLECHNLNAANTYTTVINGTTFVIPPGRFLKVAGNIPNLSLNGTGDYIVLASVALGELPSLSTTTMAGSGVPSSPADGITLLDTGAFTEVKDGGLTSAKVNVGIEIFKGLPGAAYFEFAGLPADTNTCTIVADTTVVYTFKTIPAAPTDVLIGGTAALTAENLRLAIVALQPNLRATRTGGYLDVWVSNAALIKAGQTLVMSDAAVGLTTYNTQAARAESKVSVLYGIRTVDAQDLLRGTIVLPFETTSILAATLQVRRAAAVLVLTTTISIGGQSVNVVDTGSALLAGDVVTVMVIGVVS